jgi:hypothetical protein
MEIAIASGVELSKKSQSSEELLVELLPVELPIIAGMIIKTPIKKKRIIPMVNPAIDLYPTIISPNYPK